MGWMVVEDSHSVNNPPKCENPHGYHTNRYNDFCPHRVVPLGSIPVKCNNRCVNSIQHNTDHR